MKCGSNFTFRVILKSTSLRDSANNLGCGRNFPKSTRLTAYVACSKYGLGLKGNKLNGLNCQSRWAPLSPKCHMHISNAFLKNQPPVIEASGRRRDRWFQAVDSKSDRVSLNMDMDIDETAKGTPFFVFQNSAFYLWRSKNLPTLFNITRIHVFNRRRKTRKANRGNIDGRTWKRQVHLL